MFVFSFDAPFYFNDKNYVFNNHFIAWLKKIVVFIADYTLMQNANVKKKRKRGG